MKFSIIIPARNEEGYLGRTLQSIENQNYPDYETIVVANGCTDNTVQVAEKFADKVISIGESGVSKARNLGAQNASGDVLIFLDADTLLNLGVLNEIKSKFSQKYVVGTIRVKPNAPKLRYKTMMGFKNLVNSLKLYPWMGGVVYCRRNDFSGFDENLHVKETIYFIRNMMRKGKFQFLSESQVVTSMRRYEKWGSLTLVSFFIKKWFKSFFSDVGGDKYPMIR